MTAPHCATCGNTGRKLVAFIQNYQYAQPVIVPCPDCDARVQPVATDKMEKE